MASAGETGSATHGRGEAGARLRVVPGQGEDVLDAERVKIFERLSQSM